MKAGAIIPQKIVENSDLPCYVKIVYGRVFVINVVLPAGRPPNPYGIWFLSA